MFITAWSIWKENLNQPKCLARGDWLKNTSSIHAIKLCVAMKNDVKYLKTGKCGHSEFWNKINMNGLTMFL